MSTKLTDEPGPAPENPPAFPVPPGVTTFTGDPRDGAGYEPSQSGMTLRDYFAAHVQVDDSDVQNLLHNMGKINTTIADLAAASARLRYIYADAMLAARKEAP